jgi:hypothetical protein
VTCCGSLPRSHALTLVFSISCPFSRASSPFPLLQPRCFPRPALILFASSNINPTLSARPSRRLRSSLRDIRRRLSNFLPSQEQTYDFSSVWSECIRECCSRCAEFEDSRMLFAMRRRVARGAHPQREKTEGARVQAIFSLRSLVRVPSFLPFISSRPSALSVQPLGEMRGMRGGRALFSFRFRFQLALPRHA